MKKITNLALTVAYLCLAVTLSVADIRITHLEWQDLRETGGGFYSYDRAYSEFNPHSPVAYRRFGAWVGGNRPMAYGSSFVRGDILLDKMRRGTNQRTSESLKSNAFTLSLTRALGLFLPLL